MKKVLAALILATAAFPSHAAAGGMLIACVFDKSSEKNLALGLFVPSVGSKEQPFPMEQVRDPDGLLADGGFDRIKIENGKTQLTGARSTLSLKFTGAEGYDASLKTKGQPALNGVCQVVGMSDREAAFEFFDTLRRNMRDGGKVEK